MQQEYAAMRDDEESSEGYTMYDEDIKQVLSHHPDLNFVTKSKIKHDDQESPIIDHYEDEAGIGYDQTPLNVDFDQIDDQPPEFNFSQE